MNKYFIQLFLEESTVIIPNLGALTVTNEDTGEIMFLPYLKFDDGKLADFIAKTEGVAKTDAENTIAKFVREIQAKLDQGESYDIFEFGSFSKNSEGEIEFTSTPKEGNTSTESEPQVEESSVTAAISLGDLVEEVNNTESAEESTPEPEVEEKVTDSKSLLDDILAESKPEEKVEEPKEETPVAATPPSAEEPVKESVKEEKPAETKKEVPKKEKLKKESKKAPKKVIQENELIDKKPKKKKKGFAFYLLLFFIAVFIGAGVWGYMNLDILREHIPFLAEEERKEYKSILDSEEDHIQVMKELSGMTDSSGTDETVEPTNEEIAASQKTEEQKVVEPKPKATPKPVEKKPEPKPVAKKTEPKTTPTKTNTGAASPGGSFYVIVGSFSSAENANNLAAKLKSEGFTSSTLPNGTMTMVSAGAFPSGTAAREFINNNPSVGKGWIYKK